MEIFVWPLVVLILSGFFMLLFKKPISTLIDRTEKISKHGIQTTNSPGQQGEKVGSKVQESLRVYDNQLLSETERFIQAHLETLHPKDETEREQFLLRNMAALAITWSFDRAYYLIYGSQIAALQFLNHKRNSLLRIEHIESFYRDAVAGFPDVYRNYTFNEWLHFLVAVNFVQRNGDDVGITIRGKEFLKFLVEQGNPLIKNG